MPTNLMSTLHIFLIHRVIKLGATYIFEFVSILALLLSEHYFCNIEALSLICDRIAYIIIATK